MTVRVIAAVKAEPRFGPGGMELWQFDGLSLWKRPAWFRRLVRRDFGGNFHARWFDHYSTDGKDTLICEPYGLHDGDLRDLLAFADKYDLSVGISATSQHYPTRTLAVFLTPRGKAVRNE